MGKKKSCLQNGDFFLAVLLFIVCILRLQKFILNARKKNTVKYNLYLPIKLDSLKSTMKLDSKIIALSIRIKIFI